MERVLMVGLGGFIGSVLRYWLAGLAQPRRSAFPLGTLVVNVLGCLVIGVVGKLIETRGFLDPATRALVVIGVLGGFTTFSTFSNESILAAEDGAVGMAVVNVAGTVLLCLAATWAGRQAVQLIWR
ncbi:MAG: fluoride efflux transporter CrcB [Gemmatimonadales bacterium]